MTTVLAAIASDASGRSVLNTAIALGTLLDASVTALHVREPGLDAAAAVELAAAAGVMLREAHGDPVAQIVTAARAPDVAALVLGIRGAHDGPHPGGHTALAVITQAPKPVAVVPPQAHLPTQISRILVPLQGTRESSVALDDVLQIAHHHRLEVIALHIHSPATVPAFADHAPHAATAWEQEFLARYTSIPPERVTLLRRLGVPADDILAAARDSGADLIVLAWSQSLARGHAHVISETLAHTDIPVLLLPVKEASPPQTDTAR